MTTEPAASPSKYDVVYKDTMDLLDRMREELPEFADYLKEHLIFDPVNKTLMYTGFKIVVPDDDKKPSQ